MTPIPKKDVSATNKVESISATSTMPKGADQLPIAYTLIPLLHIWINSNALTTNVITAIIDEAIRRIRKLLPQGGKSNITAANIGNKIGKEVKC
jgi:hypothetical protein